MQRPLLIRRSFVFVLLICFAATLVPVRAGAQAEPIKEKKADLSTFVGYTRLSPDYGGLPDNLNNGVVFGAFYTRYLHWFAPAVEFRGKIANGHTVDEKTYGGGIRVEKSFRRYRPFGDFLVSAGTIKYHIPEAHSDFIFAVAGEEFGLVLCALIAALFCLLSVRLLLRSARMNDAFASLSGAGLAAVVALQAFINMGVAVSLLPAKGMTLPFISYGGSSLFAVAVTMGFALAVTRERSRIGERPTGFPDLTREPIHA